MELIHLVSTAFNNFYKSANRLQVLLKIKRDISYKRKDIGSSY